MEIKLYPVDPTSTTLEDDLTFQWQNLQFSTKLPGGFSICSFQLKADLPAAWDWLSTKGFHRLVISDGNKTLWEGRIEEPRLSSGCAGVTAYGYWASMTDNPYNTAYNANMDVIFKAVLTASCPQISSDQSHITATGGPAITSAANSSYLDISAQSLVLKLLDFSDTTLNAKWYFAVWESRIPYLFTRSVTSVDWLVSLEDLAQFKLQHRYGLLYNSVYAIYTAAGVLSRTAVANDTTSQTKYGVTRQYAIPNLGEVAAATAQSSRDAFLANNKTVYPNLPTIVLGDRVFDTKGVKYPSSWVRAGDVIRIKNLIPATGDLSTVAQNALNTFYIIETNYDATQGQNQLIVDTQNNNLDALLARSI